MTPRNRVAEVLQLPATELKTNEGNWRLHPAAQGETVRGLLDEIGIADRLLAYRSEREGGALVLIDGHLRRELAPDAIWTVLVLDLSDAEADLLLTALDPTAAMAETNHRRLQSLLDGIRASNQAVTTFLNASSARVAESLAAMTSAYKPNLEPVLGTRLVEAGDVERAKEKLDTYYQREQELEKVMCPHCGGQFYLDG